MTSFKIAIDGPAGAGKSTVAKQLAKKLGFIYIDTGAMYRAVALNALNENQIIDDLKEEILGEIAKKSVIQLAQTSEGKEQVFLNGIDVTEIIRSPEVTRLVSSVAKNPQVRKVLVKQQRKLADNQSVVMDGRDIGTQVFPDAQLKIFLTATVKQRAMRRWKELTDQGKQINLESIEQEISDRDKMDEERAASPLIPAVDAIHMDTTNQTIEEVVAELTRLYTEKVQSCTK